MKNFLILPFVLTLSQCVLISSEETSTPLATPLTPTNLVLGQVVTDFWTIPANGNPRVLVVPVEFNNSIYSNAPLIQQQIDQAFNGNSPSFESLNSFYLKSSFNNLDLDGEIGPIFRTQYNAEYYANLTHTDANTVIIDEIMEAYNGLYDFTDFDFNQDGILDGLYMVYNFPAADWDSFWWAYLYQYFGTKSYDGVKPASYVWMPYEFVVVNGQIDASTFIHETGHKLGLEDYYDYAVSDGSNNEFGLGGADIMDASVGDHNPFSKLLLGWIEPKVVTESMDITLLPYIHSGQALIITDSWKGTLFDEYLIAMYYTPTGLYQGWNDYYFDGRSGMVLYHVDARLGNNPSSVYPSVFLNNNTDTPFKLIRFIEADGNNSLYNANPKGWMWEGDVYRPGNIFNENRNIGYRWNQIQRGTVGFTIQVSKENGLYQSLQIKVRY